MIFKGQSRVSTHTHIKLPLICLLCEIISQLMLKWLIAVLFRSLRPLGLIFEKYLSLSPSLTIVRADGSGSATPTLVGPKIVPFAVKVLYCQDFGLTNNCLVEVFLKWSDQSRTPGAPEI